ncbi:sensor histidine kinase [Desertibacillus haloalkaliphilus]|uniref:sensor histidine kinase n=1 Tax=Desertibacillus haloalkaliphilus TaxID=1328930 RepID=UPI001C26B049|nr:HAMP domain-containing sensor histidine kinase [Desertibacillus haloalkaliphilus]MBU8905284.1 HAMP domain-containing histidine kinase [Desertibacillus haloalkaliphilus]
MDYAVQHLLLNVLFIIIPLFIYQIFFLDNHTYHKKINYFPIIVLGCTSIVLCLSFPISFFEGFILDLRQIPLILGAIYGGYIVSLPMFITIVMYRFSLGGDGVYINFFVICSIMLFVPLLRAKFLSLSPNHRIIVTSTLSFISSTLLVSMIHQFDPTSLAGGTVSLNYIMIQSLCIALVTYLIEKMRANVYMKEQIQVLEKQNVTNQLAASISHEVRNPLTVTKGFLQLLDSGQLTEKQRASYIELALSELNRADTIIGDFLSFSKPSKHDEKCNNLVDDIKQIQSILSPYASNNQVEVVTSFKADTYEVQYDPHKLRQCLINIGKNAIEAMPDGGRLEFNVYHDNHQVITEIKDNGIGMSNGEIKRIGTPYFTTKETGTGLGMMVVFNIIKAMNGSIRIKSKRGKGTTFFVMLPEYR